eukprot:484545-Prorocentrum_minimum.AAC.2
MRARRTAFWAPSEAHLLCSFVASARPPVVRYATGVAFYPQQQLSLNSNLVIGCLQVFGKCEFLNPAGSVKDRVAARIVQEVLDSGTLPPGGLITEGTSGSTGISLAMVARAHGLQCYVSLPDDAAAEKAQVLEALGADVERVRPVSITHQDHFVNKARRKAQGEATTSISHENTSKPGGVFADQFENLANTRAHYAGTAPEIWEQTAGQVDAFLAGSGTGGTLAGVSQYLKERNQNVRIYLVDPPGSSLHNKVRLATPLQPPSKDLNPNINPNLVPARKPFTSSCGEGAPV